MARRDLINPETARLTEIRDLDLSALRPKIERLTRLARSIADVPYSYVTLEEEDHEWTSAFEALPEQKVPSEHSITAFIIKVGQTIYTQDARLFIRNHPWVAGPPYLRFYCAAPIRLASGLIIGAFCVASPEPREYDPALGPMIEDIAALLADEIGRLRAERQKDEAQSKARATQELLRSFVRSAPVALAMTDADLRFIECSQRWRTEQGVQGRVLGRRVAEVFPDGFAQWGAFWERALAGETINADRVEVLGPDGRHRWMRVELGPWRDHRGDIAGVVAMTSDITDVIKALAHAERSEQRLRLAVEIAELMVYEADFRTGEVLVEGAEDTFLDRPLTFEELTQTPWISVHPDYREQAAAFWDECQRTGKPFRTEYRMSRSDAEVWAFSAAELVRGPDGRPDRLVGVLKDMSARHRAEAALIDARDAAQAANRAKSEFLANMSHEIRTPLNGVVGVATALGRTTLTPDQQEMVGLVQSSASALETILSDVLDFSRIEAGRLEMRTERFELESCLRSAAALFQATARDKGLTFRVEVASDIRNLFEGDAGRIRQVLFNLVSNAVKFTRTGGVEVTAAAVGRNGDIQQVAISVTDTGIGFDEATKARLFERFEQGDGSITRQFGGSGLGLAISRALAEALGGRLEASSRPGKGSRFTLTLPLKRLAAKKLAPPPHVEPPTLERAPRVLLAEDHAVNRRVVELILGAAGVELVWVENGRQAVEAAARGGFDLILMDMQMPEMDGLSAIRAIRADERAAGRVPTPIWALSANALPEHEQASLAAGADGHLTKPISAPALYQVLAGACGAPAAPEAVVA
ncbi:MAG TPA: ATP-binding protein [Caulobacteraceae bacterium]